MPILEKGKTYAEDDQLTHTNLNALVDSASFVKAGSAVTGATNTTDETTLDLDGTGQLIIKSGGVRSTQLADSAVTTAKINDLAVSTAKIAALGVTTAKIAADAITEAKIADGAVESEHLNNNVISGQTETTDEPADADELLYSDAGTLRRISIANLAKCRFFPQAYGIVDFENGAETTLVGSYGVASVADDAGLNKERQVTLSNAMTDTNYVVLISIEDQGNLANDWTTPNVYIDSTTKFTIHIAESPNLRIHFAVFGNRA